MILADFCCPYHGRFEALAESDAEWHPCPVWMVHGHANPATSVEAPCDCQSPWSPSPVRGRVRIGEVVRGGVDKPDSPMMLDTRELGNGMPMEEWRARRDKMYEERRWKESKEF